MTQSQGQEPEYGTLPLGPDGTPDPIPGPGEEDAVPAAPVQDDMGEDEHDATDR